jgi:hypothetical protein
VLDDFHVGYFKGMFAIAFQVVLLAAFVFGVRHSPFFSSQVQSVTKGHNQPVQANRCRAQ